MRRTFQFSLILLILLATASSAFAGRYSAAFPVYLSEHQNDEMVTAIVTMADRVDLRSLQDGLYAIHADRQLWHETVVRALQTKATETQADLMAFLSDQASLGNVEKYQGLWVGNVVIITAKPEVFDRIVAREDVDMVSPDYAISSIQPVSRGGDEPSIAGHEIGLERVAADQCWAMGITGDGRLVSSLDTGVEGGHPALENRWAGLDPQYAGHPEWAWFDPVTNTDFPFDSGQHGTHTMGTICGRSETTSDTVGVAIDAHWISCGVIDRGGIGPTVTNALLSFEWSVDPDGDPSTVWDVPDVSSNSWGVTTGHGYPDCDETFWTVLDGCEAAGIVVVFAAGNEGPGATTLRRPADRATTDLTSFSVAAVDGNNNNLPIADFSSRGPSYCTPTGDETFKPEVAAPGVNVRSSVPGGGYQGGWSGTSMATPHIAGIVALMRQANPNLTSEQVRQILLDTAVDLGPDGEDNSYGMGIANAYEAVLRALAYLEGWGTLAGVVTDQASGNPIAGAHISVVGRPWGANTRANGSYALFVPADTAWTIRIEHPPLHLPMYDTITVVENDTLIQNYALEGKVTTTLRASFGNPVDASYRSFFIKGSWDADGFYNAGWTAPAIEIKDDGVAPDQTANDGIFTGTALLARDLVHTYQWALYTENYGGEASRLQNGANFTIPTLTPPTVPILSVNPSGSDHNWNVSVYGNGGSLVLDLTRGVNGRPTKWGSAIALTGGVQYTIRFRVMHSAIASYGAGGVGGADISYTPPVDGSYDFIFDDRDDSYVIQLTGTEGPPTYLSVRSGLDGHIPVSWLPPGTVESQEMSFDDGALVNAYYYYAYDNLMGTMFEPTGATVIDSAIVHVLTEGDPYWPWPDGANDPIGISIYLDDGSGYPEADPVWYGEGTAEPGQWVRVDVPEVEAPGNFWIMMNNLDGGGDDGIGLDAATDYPANKWVREGGAWGQSDMYAGDHMIRAKVFGGTLDGWMGYDASPASLLPANVPILGNPALTTGSATANKQLSATSREDVSRLSYHPNLSRVNPPTITDTEVLAGYNLYRGTSTNPYNGGASNRVNSELILVTNYDDWGTDPNGPIVNGTLYYYQAGAVYDIGGGQFVEVGPSNEGSGAAMNHPPAEPQNLTGTTLGNTITLNWNANTDYDIASYRIFRRDYNAQEFVLVGTITHPTTTFSEVLSVDGIYRYKIAAVDNGTPPLQSVRFSNSVDLPIGAIPPRDLRASTDQEFQITVKWKHPGGGGGGDNVVLVVAADEGSMLISELQGYEDVTQIDYYDARNGTPTLDELEPYSDVILWSNYPFADPTGMGDVMADYVDNGGTVIMGQFCFGSGWGLEGRIMNEYSPFNQGPTLYVFHNLGDYDPTDPLMEGVTEVSDLYIASCSVVNNGTLVASWDDGTPFVAYNPELPVIAINAYVGDQRQFTGDMITIVHNALNAGGGGEVIPQTYNLFRATSEGGPYNPLVSVPGTQKTYVDTPVPNAVDYWYRLTAVYPGPDESDPSNIAQGRAMNYPPSAPFDLAGTVNDRTINTDWSFTDLKGDWAHFNIYKRLMPSGNTILVGTSTDSSYSFNIPVGEDGVYKITITAVDDGNPPLESLPSREVYLAVGHLPPGALVAMSGYEFEVPLRWMLPGTWRALAGSAPYREPQAPRPLDMSHKGEITPENPPIITGRGGPDNFGYEWVDSDEADGPSFFWRDIVDIGELLPVNSDDQNVGPYDIGFDVEYYGEIYNQFYVCSNGWVSFTSTDAMYSNTELPNPSAPLNMLAPFWDDLYPPSGGQYYFYSDGSELVISFVDVMHIGGSGPYTFQVVVRSSGNILFNYLSLGGATNTCTVGMQNGDGTDGLMMAFNADYLHDELAIRLASSPEGISPVHFKLYRATSPNVPLDPAHLLNGSIGGDQTTYSDLNGIVNGTTYYYRITAVWSDSVESPPANEASGTPANHNPLAPYGLQGTVDNRNIALHWSFNNAMHDLDHFNIYRKLVPGGTYALAGTSTDTMATIVIPAGQDGVWAVAVTAVDNGTPQMESDYSNAPFFPVGNLPPTNLRATTNQESVVPLRWNEPGMRPTTTLSYDDGTLANAYYYYDYANIMAEMFDVDGSAEIETLWVHVLTEGDAYWPWPDGSADPIGISVFDDDGSGYPGDQVFYQEATGELGQWVMVPIEGGLTVNGPHFWVGMQNLDGGGDDGIGLDAATDYPENKWNYFSGSWVNQDLYSGDHMIRATIIDNGRSFTLHENAPSKELAMQNAPASFGDAAVAVAIPGKLSMNSISGNNNGDIERPFDTAVLLGYSIYRATAPNVPIDAPHRIRVYTAQGVSTSYNDSTVVNGTTYYYKVTAVYDNNSVIEESPGSNEVSATPLMGGRMVLNPLFYNVLGEPGGIVSQTLNIANPGGLQLNYSIFANTNNRALSGRQNNGFAIDAGYRGRQVTADKSNLPEEPRNPPVLLGRGGPDEFGYIWIDSDEEDGPDYEWIDITGMGEQVPISGDDENIGPYDLGFGFPYYGEIFNSIQICSNGWISPTSYDAVYSNGPLPDPSAPSHMIAPLWDDLYFPDGGECWFYADGNQAVISYIGVPHIGGAGPYTFQVILSANGSITYNYDTTYPEDSATIGIQNGDGTIGLMMAYNAGYVHDQMAVRIISSWLSADPAAGSVAPGGNTNVNVIFDATYLGLGDYTGSLIVTGTDENHQVAQIAVPVTFHVVIDAIDDPSEILPSEFSLAQNFPNPFNPTTGIDFALPIKSHVTLEVFNVLGQKVKTLVNSDMEAGYKSVIWDGTNQAGASVTSGTYFYILKAGDKSFTKKMTMLK